MGRRLEGSATRIRRATRHDLVRLRQLLAGPAVARSERFDRRLLRHLGSEVSVVEGGDGTLAGAVSITFVRSFLAGHWRAQLDGVWVAPGHDPLLDPLVAAALQRAAHRHCHELFVLGPLEPRLAAALERRGAAREGAWRFAVVPAAAVPGRRGRRRRS